MTLAIPQTISTGIPTLDEILEGLCWGESIVFHAGARHEFLPFLNHFAHFLESQGIAGRHIRFAGTECFELQPIAFQPLVLAVRDLPGPLNDLLRLMAAPGAACAYLYEAVAPLQGDEAEAVRLFEAFASQVREQCAAAYVFLQKGKLSNQSVARFVEASSVFVDLWSLDQKLFLQPIKAARRYSEKLFMPYQVLDGAISPASGGETEEYIQVLEKKSREFLELYSQKRQVENDLQRKVYDLSVINGLTSSLLSTMNLEEILYRILVGVTAKEGLGFNRAFLLLVNDQEQVLEGKMAIGPSSLEEAIRIWTDLADRHLTYPDLLAAFDTGWQEHDAFVNQLVRQIRVPLAERSHVLIDLLMQTQPEVMGHGGTRSHPSADRILEMLGVPRVAAAPLVYRKRQMGLLMADNLISHKPISEDDLRILETFANYASTAIEHSRLYEEVRVRIKESERHISELEAMQNRLMRSKKLSDLGELASKMAHELRTPLVSIGGFANAVLKRQSPASPDHADLQIIVSEVRRLEAIIRNVLAYVSPGIPRSQWIDLRELCGKVLKLMQTSFAEKRIEVTTQFVANLPQVAVDPEQIQLVLTAVINNAVESMPDGGRLVVAIQSGHDFVRLSVADTGAGIPENDLAKVFDAFFTTKSLGSGLGLNISSQIIANHKGSIYAESRVGEGSTFFINFPIVAH